MSTIYANVLSNEELDYLNNHPAVLKAKASLDIKQSGRVNFSVPMTDALRTTLQSQFGLNLSEVSEVPMRWIKGDTEPHVDFGPSHFEHTYLVYLNDSPGEFIVDTQSYPIQSNSGFVFNEGLSHETKNTNNVPRLLLGPMNEFAEPVGDTTVSIFYFVSKDAALNYPTSIPIASNIFANYKVGDISGGSIGSYTSWKIASTNNSTIVNLDTIYSNNETLPSGGNLYQYYLYQSNPSNPSVPCFLEGSTILSLVNGLEEYVPVEQLKAGTLVKTSLDGYKPVVLVGKRPIQNPGDDERTKNRLYKCSCSKYPDLKEDLYITGCHSILEFPLTKKQEEETIKHLGQLFVTDKKHRLMACVDERAEPWNSEGTYTIWHFALEHDDEKMNYGVYANGGLLVETCSINFLKNRSNMEIMVYTDNI